MGMRNISEKKIVQLARQDMVGALKSTQQTCEIFNKSISKSATGFFNRHHFFNHHRLLSDAQVVNGPLALPLLIPAEGDFATLVTPSPVPPHSCRALRIYAACIPMPSGGCQCAVLLSSMTIVWPLHTAVPTQTSDPKVCFLYPYALLTNTNSATSFSVVQAIREF